MKNSLLLRWSSAIALLLGSMGAVAQPTFEALFSPETIGPGADSELIFTITNAAGPVRDLAFTATLPAGLALADPVLLDTNCELAEILAPAGGSTVELLTGRLGGGSSCEVRVVVRPSTVGMFTLVTGDLNSSAGNSGNATDDLTVTASRPGFSKTYSPTSVPLLGRSTVTYIWDNSLIGGNTFNLSFNDRLPKGLVVAEPPNATIDCIASFTPVAGASVVGAFSGFLRGGETCTMTVDVIAEGAGRLASRTLDASSSTGGTIGFSANVLDVTISRPALTLQINDDPAPFADVATLEFEIINGDRSRTLTNGAFSLDLDAALSGLATALLPTNPCGAGSSLTGGSAINLSGATVPPGGRCSFEVQVSIPAAGPSGNFDLVTAPITGDLGGSMEMGNAAAEVLQVSTAPIFEKRILGGPYTPADTVTIEYTLTNPDPDNSATSISFFDRLTNDNTDFALAPANNLCNGSGNVISRDTPFPGSNFNRPAIFFGGGTLAAGASCTFTVDVTLGDVIPAGSHPGTSLPIMATVNGVAQTGQEATAVLDIITVPRIALELQQVVVAPGDTVTADVTIAYDTSAGEAATGPDALALAASIDLDAVLPGLVAIGITPGMDPCGAGSATMGTMAVDLTGGTLSIGSSCTFSIDLQVPADATPGTYLIRTSTVTGTISGSPIEAAASSAELSVSGLSARMRFVESPISASASRVMLEYTIENTSPTQTASSIQFSHDLDTLPSGLFSFSPTQNDVCGAGSSVSGTTFIIFAGGTLGPGETCSFSLDLNLPAGQVGSYTSQTGSLFGLIDGNFAVLGSAVATLDINAGLQMTKAFSPESIPVGGMGTLSFTVTNLAGTAATGVTFTDDLDAALSGLVAVATPQSDICGAGSSLTGSGSLSLTGGSLAPGETCEFSTLVMVPAGAIAGASALNTVSDLSGTIDGIGVAPAGIDAEASFSVDAITLDAQLVGIPAPGQNVVLNFDIANANVASPQRDVAFSVDLATIADAALTWPGPELTGFCGANSQAVVDLTGTVLTVRGLDLVAPTTMCSFGVTLAVGAMPVRAVYTLDTSSVLGRAGVLGGGASVVIDIPQEVGFAKAFGPTPILEDGVSTLTFMIDNTANTIAASSLDFTDNLPAGLVVAAPSNTTTTCTGGTLTAVPGSGAIAYSGGSVAAGATCALSVDVTASAQGTYVNVSGNLTSNLGTSGTASATLEVYALPVITKEYDVPSAQLGSIARLRYIIDSTAVDVDATMINFTDMLPATIVIATPANTAGTCGGTFNAAAGGSQTELINGSVPAGTSCTLEADVEIVAVGDNSSTTSAISLVLGGDLPATIDGATGGFVGIAPPELEADSYEVPEGDLLGAGAATGLLANDDDPDDDDLSVVAVDGADVVGSAYEPPAGGELTVATDGTFSFDTRADFEAL
ncbi:MAG: Ig-like domain-containing protein, partial [Pseudomonadota bacterium]